MLEAFAKVNLSLRVRGRDPAGLHPLRSLVTSVDWADTVALEDAEADAMIVHGDPSVPDDTSNLAWRGAEAMRRAAARSDAMRVTVAKRVPSAAGLAGGSADAAAALVLAARRFGVAESVRDAEAPRLGADVAFCLVGGTAWMEGYGERVTALPAGADYAMAIVVPPFPLATADVYRRWDELGGPTGPAIEGRALPVSLRAHAPLHNDLYPAAVSLVPDLGDHAADLARRWSVPVAMSGSGPALFGLFPTAGEAAGAVEAAGPVRAARACRPVSSGWR